MNVEMTFIAVQPVQAKAAPSTQMATNAPRSEAELRDAIGPRTAGWRR